MANPPFSSANPSRSVVNFLLGFLRRPRQVASIVPSSPVLERRLSSLACLATARNVVELGPGTGGTTRALLQALSASSRLLCIEINPQFIDDLRQIDDPRLLVHEGDASDLRAILAEREFPPPDVVLSGIPLSTMSHDAACTLVGEIHHVLAPGGTFVAYQLSDRVRELAEPLFGAGESSLVMCNLPPVQIYQWRKAPLPQGNRDSERE